MTPVDILRAPLFISWQLTRDCNLACLHCCTDSAPGKPLKDELTEDEAMALAADIASNEIPYVMLCGGEPLLVPHFMAVAEYLGAAGVQLKIETNGQLLDALVIERLARLPIRSIQISLDGDTQEVYERQRPGASLAKAHEACHRVRAAGLPLEITFAPTRLNIHQAEAVIARARDLGAFRFNTGQLMHIGRAAKLWGKLSPGADDYDRFRAVLSRQALEIDSKMQLCHDPFTVGAGLEQSLRTPPATMLILPNGWVKVAAAVGFICADLRQMKLSEAWLSYRAAWHHVSVIAAIKAGITEENSHAGANAWKTIPNGAMEKCAI